MMFLRIGPLEFLIFGFFEIFFDFWSVDRFFTLPRLLHCTSNPPRSPNRQKSQKNQKYELFCIRSKNLSQIGSLDNSQNEFYETANFRSKNNRKSSNKISAPKWSNLCCFQIPKAPKIRVVGPCKSRPG